MLKPYPPPPGHRRQFVQLVVQRTHALQGQLFFRPGNLSSYTWKHILPSEKPWLQFQVGHIVEQFLAGLNARTVIESVKTLISPKFTKAHAAF